MINMGSRLFYIILGSLPPGMISLISWCIGGARARGFSGNGGLHAWWPRMTLEDATCCSSLAA